LIFAVVSGFFLLSSWLLARQRNELLGATYDFGVVQRDLLLQHVFLVQNPTSGPLKIDRLVPSCSSCSTVRLVCDKPDCSVLNPGESASILVEWDAHKDAGNTRREFYLYWHNSDSADKQRIVFALTASVTS